MTDHSGLYSLLVALAIPGAGGLWRSANLRSDLFNRWQSRADTMHAGLTEGAIDLLLRLQVQITDLLGGPDAAYDPARFNADPAPVVAEVGKFDKAMRSRDRLRSRTRWLLRLGPLMCWASVVYLLGWAGASYYFVGLSDAKTLRDAGLVVLGLGLISGLLLVGSYVQLTMRLSATEVLTYEMTHSPDPGDEGAPPGSNDDGSDNE